MHRILFSLALTLLSGLAMAQTQTLVTGTIRDLNAVGSAGHAPDNLDIRVYLAGVNTFCPATTDAGFGYINVDDANFKGIVAMLSLADATGKQVSIYSVPTASSVGSFCQIAWVHVLN